MISRTLPHEAHESEPTPQIVLGNLTIDMDLFRVSVGDVPVHLTYAEFELLARLAENAGRVVAREVLLHAIWRRPSARYHTRLNTLVLRVRRKLAASDPWVIETVKRRGYVLLDRTGFPDGRT